MEAEVLWVLACGGVARVCYTFRDTLTHSIIFCMEISVVGVVESCHLNFSNHSAHSACERLAEGVDIVDERNHHDVIFASPWQDTSLDVSHDVIAL